MRDRDHIEKAFDFGGMPARNGAWPRRPWWRVDLPASMTPAGERNFFAVYGRKPAPELLVRGPASNLKSSTPTSNAGRWVRRIQAPLDCCAICLASTHLIRITSRKWSCEFHQGANTVDNRDMPDICMQHMCAVMLLDRTVTFASSHNQKRMRDRAVLALRSRIELRGDDGLTAAMPSRQGIVEITLRDGRTLSHHTKAVRGAAENPMTRAEVDEKSYDLIAQVIGKTRARKLCDAIWQLEKLSDVRSLRPLLWA